MKITHVIRLCEICAIIFLICDSDKKQEEKSGSKWKKVEESGSFWKFVKMPYKAQPVGISAETPITKLPEIKKNFHFFEFNPDS